LAWFCGRVVKEPISMFLVVVERLGWNWLWFSVKEKFIIQKAFYNKKNFMNLLNLELIRIEIKYS
jgi:hypothetical protein